MAIVGLDGYAKAKATFAARQRPYVGPAVVPLQPVAQVVGRSVYYIDGNGTVRVLRVASQPQVVATFPQQPTQYETWFAVKPDGSAVLAGVLQYPAIGAVPSPCVGMCIPPLVGPWHFSLQTAAAGGQPTVLKQLSSPTNPDAEGSGWKPIFPVGWIAEGPIAIVPSFLATQGGWDGGPLQVVANTGSLGRQVGGSDCSSASIAPTGLIACLGRPSWAVTVRDSVGTALWVTQHNATDSLSVHLSPDGQAIAESHGHGPFGTFVERRSVGIVPISESFYVEGFLDNDTVVGRQWIGNGPEQGDLSWISLSDPKTVHDLGFRGDFVGSLS